MAENTGETARFSVDADLGINDQALDQFQELLGYPELRFKTRHGASQFGHSRRLFPSVGSAGGSPCERTIRFSETR